jgi:hypothetical protein
MSIQAMYDLSVDCAFPGGNIIVDAVEGDTVAVHQDLRDTEIDWFYWYFRVQGASGRMLTVRFTESDVIGVHGPAVSMDGGWTWRWLGRGSLEGQSFRFRAPDDTAEVRFSVGMPYVGAHWQAFLEPYLGHHVLASDVLCISRGGRPVELVRVGLPASRAPYRALVTCRHHACEMMASYTLEGMLQAALANDEVGRWFQENVTLLVVPFVDKDGVEEGDQGKCRRPYDHNRDYADQSLYPEVRAIREQIPKLTGGRLDFFLDLHCPWIRGPRNEVIYFVGEPEEWLWRQVEAFSAILEASRTGPLPHDCRDNLPFGQSWNNEADSLPKRSAGWAKSLPGIRFASLIEIPYANAGSVEVNTASARAFGRDLARAMHLYLDECGR